MRQLIVVLMLALFCFESVKAQEVVKIPEWSEEVLGFSSSPDHSLSIVWGEHYLYFSRNNNLNVWFPVTLGFPKINDLAIVNNLTIVMIGDNGFVSISNDAGIHWTLLPAITVENLNRIKKTNQGIFILGDNGLILRSTDSGASWEDFSINSTSSSLKDIQFFHGSYRGLIVGDKESFRTIDSGKSWTPEPLPYDMSGIRLSMPDVPESHPDFKDFHFIIGEGDLGGSLKTPIIISRDRDGLLITAKIPESYDPRDITFKGLVGYAIANKSNGMFMRTFDGGVNWTSEYSESKLYSVSIYGEKVILTGDNGTIYIRNIITDISSSHNQIPYEYMLSQNYPNPFNPTTNINFSIPKSGNVKLAIFNLVGQEVAVILSQNLNVGNYTYNFDASNLTTGVYFYTLKSEGFTETKKMILLK